MSIHSKGMSDLDLAVACLKEALMVWVKEGLITEAQADERARNQVMGLGAYFELKRLPCYDHDWESDTTGLHFHCTKCPRTETAIVLAAMADEEARKRLSDA